MTRNLKLYALFCVLWSVPFFMVLHWMLFNPETRGPIMLLAGPIYGIGFGLAGAWLGSRDSQRAVRYSLGSRYGMTSSVISALAGTIWMVCWRREYLWTIPIYIAITAAFTWYFMVRDRKNIKGTAKERIFE
jgi:hypothetical protein